MVIIFINQPGIASSNLLVSLVNVSHCEFDQTGSGIKIPEFTMEEIDSNGVRFIDDDSGTSPEFSFTVTNGKDVAGPFSGNVIYTPNKNNIVDSNSNTLRNAIIGSSVSGGIGLLFMAVRYGIKHELRNSTQAILIDLGRGASQPLKAIYHPLIDEIVEEVFENVKTTTCICRRKSSTTAYIKAIEKIVSKMCAIGLDTSPEYLTDTRIQQIAEEIARRIKATCTKTKGTFHFISQYFTPQVLPEKIQENSDAIAAFVMSALTNTERLKAKFSPSSRGQKQGRETADVKETLDVEEQSERENREYRDTDEEGLHAIELKEFESQEHGQDPEKASLLKTMQSFDTRLKKVERFHQKQKVKSASSNAAAATPRDRDPEAREAANVSEVAVSISDSISDSVSDSASASNSATASDASDSASTALSVEEPAVARQGAQKQRQKYNNKSSKAGR